MGVPAGPGIGGFEPVADPTENKSGIGVDEGEVLQGSVGKGGRRPGLAPIGGPLNVVNARDDHPGIQVHKVDLRAAGPGPQIGPGQPTIQRPQDAAPGRDEARIVVQELNVRSPTRKAQVELVPGRPSIRGPVDPALDAQRRGHKACIMVHKLHVPHRAVAKIHLQFLPVAPPIHRADEGLPVATHPNRIGPLKVDAIIGIGSRQRIDPLKRVAIEGDLGGKQRGHCAANPAQEAEEKLFVHRRLKYRKIQANKANRSAPSVGFRRREVTQLALHGLGIKAPSLVPVDATGMVL